MTVGQLLRNVTSTELTEWEEMFTIWNEEAESTNPTPNKPADSDSSIGGPTFGGMRAGDQ